MSTSIIKRQLKGTVVSDKMNKTRVVLVERLESHPKYGQRFKVSRKFSAHDETNSTHLGDKVILQATRPMSRSKRWIIISKLT